MSAAVLRDASLADEDDASPSAQGSRGIERAWAVFTARELAGAG